MKRILALTLIVILLVVAVPTQVQATSEKQRIRNEIASDYASALTATEKESLGGYCGLMTSWQMYFMGINKYLITADGNNQYETYCNMGMTSGGHRITTYPAQEYTLLNALNTITEYGTRDAYNILVCFQWSNTEAGAQYGHAVVIYAILDGIVYFTEGFQTSFGGAEGIASELTIEQFFRYYDDWTEFEGVIAFGQKDYTITCNRYESYFYGETETPATLNSQPCPPNTRGTDSRALRKSLAGERFLVTDLYETPEGAFYYQVEDYGTVSYLPAETVTPVEFCYFDVSARDLVLPEKLEEKKDFTISGAVHTEKNRLQSVSVSVTDNAGNPVMNYTGDQEELLHGNTALEFHKLPRGQYLCDVSAQCENAWVKDGELVWESRQVCVSQKAFLVGEGELSAPAAAGAERTVKDGWVLEPDGWYYYRQGAPRSGWICDRGVDYYLRADGKVTTGWAEVNGKMRLFSQTGAMRTGWVDVPSGRYYLMSNGVAAKGWRTIDAKRYHFGEDGFMSRENWVEDGDSRYYLRTDGTRAAAGWQETSEGRFYFHSDGRALAQMVEVEGKTYVRVLHSKAPIISRNLLDVMN